VSLLHELNTPTYLFCFPQIYYIAVQDEIVNNYYQTMFVVVLWQWFGTDICGSGHI